MTNREYFASLLKCGLDRPNIRHRENPTGDIAEIVRRLTIPEQYLEGHDPEHLASMAEHIAMIVQRPLEIVLVGSIRLVNVLGMVVFECRPDRTFSVFVWQPDEQHQNWVLKESDGRGIPLIDFPRTTLWSDNLATLFRHEALCRLGDEEKAKAWADFVWAKSIAPIVESAPIELLRLAVREALQPRQSTIRKLQERQAKGLLERIDVIDYNLMRIEEIWARENLRLFRKGVAGECQQQKIGGYLH